MPYPHPSSSALTSQNLSLTMSSPGSPECQVNEGTTGSICDGVCADINHSAGALVTTLTNQPFQSLLNESNLIPTYWCVSLALQMDKEGCGGAGERRPLMATHMALSRHD